MCGILVFKETSSGDNSRIRLRGQDHTNHIKRHNLNFVHNLLWVTGERTPQPFVDEDADIVCLYNGEIYNQDYVRSDGEVLIPLYKKHGPNFARLLDGEFAIALYDFKRDVAVFSTDPFGTKPIYINGVECGSYRSGVGGERQPANRVRIVCLTTGETLAYEQLHRWDFSNQWVDNYDRWIAAFEKAVAKRATTGCFIGLSSGYDSGGIACALARAQVGFKAYSYLGQEDKAVLTARAAIACNHQWFEPQKSVKDLFHFLYAPGDNEKYTIRYDGVETSMRLLDDGGIYGVGTYSMMAHGERRKVALSGQGADEILSDYALFPQQSELKGVFPDFLSPWWNFDRGCQESYLLKEEYAGGAFNIETRYPFLDRQLVQEFLNLTPRAKNHEYKAPLAEYLRRHAYPFVPKKKIGFSVTI